MKFEIKYLSICMLLVASSCYQIDEQTIFVDSTFDLPKDGEDNSNGSIGPFCCTGNTVTIEHVDGYPVGYIYFMNWEGHAYNVDGFSVFPNMQLMVSGIKDIGDSTSGFEEGSVLIVPEQKSFDTVFTTESGSLRFEFRLVEAEFYAFENESISYFKSDTMHVKAHIEKI